MNILVDVIRPGTWGATAVRLRPREIVVNFWPGSGVSGVALVGVTHRFSQDLAWDLRATIGGSVYRYPSMRLVQYDIEDDGYTLNFEAC